MVPESNLTKIEQRGNVCVEGVFYMLVITRITKQMFVTGGLYTVCIDRLTLFKWTACTGANHTNISGQESVI